MTKNILVVAAHPDDEILGAAGSMAKHAANGEIVHTIFMADGVTSRSSDTATSECRERNKAAFQAAKIVGSQEPRFLSLPDNRMDSVDLLDIVKPLESVIQEIKPEVIYTHHYGDLNIDHQMTHKAVMTACRPQYHEQVMTILCFEVLSSTEWQTPGSGNAFEPNWFVDISQTFNLKLDALKSYEAEMRDAPHSRSINNVENQAGLRGSQIFTQFAEAFVLARHIN